MPVSSFFRWAARAASIAAVTSVAGAFQTAPTAGLVARQVPRVSSGPPAVAATALIDGEADEAALLAASTFPIEPDRLIARAKEVLAAGVGVKDGGACLADEFEFVAAVVGPLGKTEFLSALASFKLEDAFPDYNARFHLFRVDPFQPSRVYFMGRTTGTHTGSLFGKPPSQKKLELPPQCYHLDFDEAGQVTEFGFYVVDRRQGNTGGLGGAFGFFYGVGQPLPVPECQPYRPSLQFRFLNFVGTLGRRLMSLRKKPADEESGPAVA